ncbi:MAG: lytic transglycosylase domain-containing protein [Deltaproteobacteria bacterium]|nr:lytic transglycosylase domain-containing protein [Deltaproteobacteria bacterium]
MSAFLLFTTLALAAREQCVEAFPKRLPSSARAYFDTFDGIFAAVAERRGLDPALLKAHAWCETRLDPCAVSPAGASGLMGFMPQTFAEVSTAAGATDPFDPADSVEAAGVYLAALINYWKGDLSAVVASYNAGPAAVAAARRRGLVIPAIEETQGYVRCVLSAHRALSRGDRSSSWKRLIAALTN